MCNFDVPSIAEEEYDNIYITFTARSTQQVFLKSRKIIFLRKCMTSHRTFVCNVVIVN